MDSMNKAEACPAAIQRLVVELVDTLALEASARNGRVGSNPTWATKRLQRGAGR